MALLLSVGCAVDDSSRERGSASLVFADNFSAKHPVGKGGVQPFLEYVRANGAQVGLTIDYYGPGQLGKQKDVLVLLRSGAIDISPVIPSYLANELPLSSVADLPGMAADPCRTAAALTPMIKPGGLIYDRELETRGVLPLWTSIISDYEVYTTEVKVKRPSDLRGRLIRSPGGVGDRVVRGLGAAPVSIPVSDLYEAVARQTVSGAALARYSVPSYSLEEVLHYGTEGANLSATTALLAISPRAWRGLTQEQRRVLDEASEVAQRGVCTSVQEATAKATATMKAAGVEITPIAGSDEDAWAQALRPVREQWVGDLESRGLPAGRALTQLETRLEGAVE